MGSEPVAKGWRAHSRSGVRRPPAAGPVRLMPVGLRWSGAPAYGRSLRPRSVAKERSFDRSGRAWSGPVVEMPRISTGRGRSSVPGDPEPKHLDESRPNIPASGEGSSLPIIRKRPYDLHGRHAHTHYLAHESHDVSGIVLGVRVGLSLYLVLVDHPFERRPRLRGDIRIPPPEFRPGSPTRLLGATAGLR